VQEGALTVGTVAAFLQLVRRFFQPLQDLSEKFNILQAAMAAAERIFTLLDTPATEGAERTPDRDARVKALQGAGVTITFEDVWFHYAGAQGISEDVITSGDRPREVPGEQSREESRERATAERQASWVLRGVSFTVSPGQTLALVGHTGAGKSTIVNLLLRFYEPQRGRITLNGEDIRQIPLDVLRAVIGYVQQDIFLFAGDVASNIRLSANLDQAALDRAAQRVGADRIIARLPGGWSHVLAERGAGVSVGERQLLAFARAVALDPALLILDEATSAVDSEIEADIQRAVATLMQGRTTIAIAHRLSTIASADQILVLHHGEVVERGDHRSLVAAGGLYERLSRLERGLGARTAASPERPVRLPSPATTT
jgi:ATP-binding cassette subfamily B protein